VLGYTDQQALRMPMERIRIAYKARLDFEIDINPMIKKPESFPIPTQTPEEFFAMLKRRQKAKNG
jgi:hypothetical protein